VRQLAPPARSAKGGRPPSPSYLVHPEVHQPAATVHAINPTRRTA
jgi:replicative DNA helicase